MHTTGDPLTNDSIIVLLPRFKGGLPSGVNGVEFYDSSLPRTTRTKSRVGSKTLLGSSRSSMCVRLALLGIHELSIPLSDSAGDRYPHDGCRYPNESYGYTNKSHGYPNKSYRYSNNGRRYTSEGIDRAGRCFQPKPLGRCNLLISNTGILTIA
jgi:hypothetical protein